MGAHVSAVPNEQNGRSTPLETRGITAMSGAFGYEMDLGKCTAEEKRKIRCQVERYKAYSDLIHNGDYYRLSSPFSDSTYTAWEQVSPDRRQALVSVVQGCTNAAPPFYTLQLKGLNPAFQYQTDRDGIFQSQADRDNSLYSGDALMNAGYPLPQLQGDYLAFQIYLKVVE